MNRWTAFYAKFARDESGATAIEYGMILMMIVIGIIALLEQIGASVLGFFTAVQAGFT
jgi:pilus assembly protein Flp/PilA